MTVSIVFETDNAAFEEPGEAGRILREIAVHIDAGMAEGSIQDINGNRIGEYSMKQKEESSMTTELTWETEEASEYLEEEA